ncbi:hypothetical protein [Nocardia wallacei]|uniref:hypothetical protein n=1 Tax=Nocardia wallacei TaxID=480035 RepID=UPI00245649C5|nr:hypothetical protein [Nocardia wallacei]
MPREVTAGDITTAVVEGFLDSVRVNTDELIEMGMEARDRYHALEEAVRGYALAQDSRQVAHDLYTLVSRVRNVPLSDLRGAG